MKLEIMVMRLRRFLLIILKCCKIESTGVAFRAIAPIGDALLISNISLMPDTTPRSFTSL
ncbi:MAG: hypothetical protein JW837_00860 [Sedimentisphaerales bacterium]|nr:hypothetical protein [Sedimentisphaerales bacterium]